MTLPLERSRSVRYAREFLRDLLDPSKTPKVPLSVRKRAYSVLRHFPADYHVNYAADGAPSEWGHLENNSLNDFEDMLKEAQERISMRESEKVEKKAKRLKKKCQK